MLANGMILILMVHVTSKIILFITYLLGDEQELSLGMLNTSETYLKILMFHACLVSTLLSFVYTLRFFYIFDGTNLLTSCHSASCLFSSVFCSRKAENQYSWNWMGQEPKSIFYHGRQEVQGGDGEAPQGQHTPLGAGGPTK